MASTGLAPASSAAPHAGSPFPALPLPGSSDLTLCSLGFSGLCSTLAQSVSFKPCCEILKAETILAPLVTGLWAEKKKKKQRQWQQWKGARSRLSPKVRARTVLSGTVAISHVQHVQHVKGII